MSPEISVPKERIGQIVLALPCPDCEGKIQTYEVLDEPLKAACYKCGTEIDLETVKIVYEKK